jgi:DNA adenine methylase
MYPSSLSYHIMTTTTTKPLIKWIGGKTQILDHVLAQFPPEMSHYHEIFLGGGSVLLALLDRVHRGEIKVHGTIYAYDMNESLIQFYQDVQLQPNELYQEMVKLIHVFEQLPTKDGKEDEICRKPTTYEEATSCQESYYYWIRAKYNAIIAPQQEEYQEYTLLESAYFLFLNKTCFRGMYRVGPNGFNVPYGHYKHPEIVSMAHLETVHRCIQGVRFICADFRASIPLIHGNTEFVYMDPPYFPETTTSFVGYTEGGFTLDMHEQLHSLTRELTLQKTPWLMSNADVPWIREQYTGHDIHSLVCKRTINAKNPNAMTNEVLIRSERRPT